MPIWDLRKAEEHLEPENRTQHLIYMLPTQVFTLENVARCPVCSPACCAAQQTWDARDFLVLPILAAAGLGQTRLNNAPGDGFSLRKYFRLRLKCIV